MILDDDLERKVESELARSAEWNRETLEAEITRLRQLLSEAEKREREARAKALEEAAIIVDGVSHEGLHNSMWRYRFESVAAAIRALQSEER